MLEVRLLGKFEIQLDGKPVQLSSRAAQSLFAFLILSAGVQHRREKLAGMFWPDAPEDKARGYLRYELWRIRKAFSLIVNTEYIKSDDMSISFGHATEYWLDVRELMELSDASTTRELMQKLVVYQGELLPGFYEEWISQEREQIQVVYEQMMGRLLENLEIEKRWHEILSWSEQWLITNTISETAYRSILIAYQKLGDRTKVVATYDRYTRAMQSLGLEPSEELRNLTIRRSSNLNIPIPLTSFIGRERELREISELFSRSRLITLTGSGGVGKTRLAIQLVSEILDRFPDGVWFLDLAPLSEGELVADTLANLLGLTASTALPISSLLLNFFRTRTSLVIFDNCEHLIESCALFIHSLLMSCESLAILATSREALRISGEISYRVPSLEIPPSEIELMAEELLKMDSVKLFAQRAAVASPGFEINAKNALTIAGICQRLDGIPLAIELAAARTNLLGVEQIFGWLDDRFTLLSNGLRSSMPRHATLRATMEWSHNLLSSQEQTLFRRLSIFVGGWTLEAAENICADVSLKRSEILDLLEGLINKSIVMAEREFHGSLNIGETRVRFWMLETVRQFASEKFKEANEIIYFRDSHLAYFLDFAERADPNLIRAEQVDWLPLLDSDYENLRTAFDWALMKDSSEMALRLCAALGSFWMIRSFYIEGLKWLKSALSKPSIEHSAAERSARSKALYQEARFADAVDDIERIKKSAELSLSLANQATDKRGLAIARFYAGIGMHRNDGNSSAISFLEQSLEEFRELNEPYWVAYSFRQLGYLLEKYGKHKRGTWYSQGVELARRAGERLNLADALWDCFSLFYYSNRPQEALSYVEEADGLYKQLGSRFNWTPWALGTIAWLDQDYGKAKRYFEELQERYRLMGERNQRSILMAALGQISLEEGDLDQAQAYFEAALNSARELENQESMAFRLAELSNVYFMQGQKDKFRQFLREAVYISKSFYSNAKVIILNSLLFSIHLQWLSVSVRILGALYTFEKVNELQVLGPLHTRLNSQVEAHARELLGKAEFEQEFEEGQTLSLDAALDMILLMVEEY